MTPNNEKISRQQGSEPEQDWSLCISITQLGNYESKIASETDTDHNLPCGMIIPVCNPRLRQAPAFLLSFGVGKSFLLENQKLT